jgi:predicted nucleic acid-binding protein
VKPKPSSAVRAWIDSRDEESLYLSVLTLGELRQGIEMTRNEPARRAKLEQTLADFQGRFAGRILGIDSVVAEMWGEMNGRARADGRLLSAIDSLLAATALVHRLVVVTRNAKHFAATGATTFDPF